MASVIKNVWGATIVSQEIERGNIIAYETGIFFFLLYIEVESLP